MQKKYIILSYCILICNTAFSQPKAYNNWAELINVANSGDYKAASILLEVKNEIEKSPSWTAEIRNLYLDAITGLCGYCCNIGLYKEQDNLIKEAYDVYYNRDSICNNMQIRALGTLAVKLKFQIKDYDSALNYGHRVLALYEDINDRGIEYCLLCMNLGIAYYENGNILKAKLFIDEAGEIIDILKKENLCKDLELFLKNAKGIVCMSLKQYANAIAYFKEVVNTSSPDTLGSTYYLALNNLALACLNIGKYGDAVSILEKVEKVEPYIDYIRFQNLALVHYKLGNIKKALNYLDEYNNVFFSNAQRIISSFAEAEREAYFQMNNMELIFLNNLISKKNKSVLAKAFDVNLYSRSISSKIYELLRKSCNNSPLMCNLNVLRQELIKKDLLSSVRDSLRREIIRNERALLSSDSTLIERIFARLGSYKEVKKSIVNGEAIVLFCYIPQMPSLSEVEGHYGAFVISHNMKNIELVMLGGVDESEHVFNNDASAEFISDLYSYEKAYKLYTLLWLPLEKYLKGAKNIYYSTVGPLSTVNFEALVNKKGKRLGDTANLIMLSSPAEVPNIYKSIDMSSDIIAFGAPAFSITKEDMVKHATKYSQISGIGITKELSMRSENLRGDWQEINGTKREIESIAGLCNNKGMRVAKYLGKDASEEAVKALSGNSPKILHIATHGFVISNREQYNKNIFARSISTISKKNDYMLWSGLVLSGGNNTWRGDTIPDDTEDGILTADEISRLDLSNTDLVVLSACETARGHIDPLEGVWGLQRAFKQAGVKTILMTLWKVSDEITTMFMEEFYKNLLNGASVRQSVRNAQKYLIKSGASDPFYWAPFVVID